MLGIIVATYAATLVVFGQMLLEVEFGESFARFAPVVLPLALSHVAGVWGSGAATGLRALGAGRELVVAQAVGTSAKLVLVALLVSPFGLLGGAWALSIGAATHSSALWLKLLGGTRDQPARGSDGSASDSLSRNRGTIER